ncbi:hypothetical protein [Streptomyces sp. NBC_01197]|uniref:hypothetical protein n=1 Tax=Streptomyces sp. NBC_01197 TaxID=2903768 RepID=UPI002E0E417E|nr:hypothetical protein OG452_05410 [Streptomyces sp. NBC_01197]
MSARDDLFNEVLDGLKSGDVRLENPEALANEYINDFAHELAEQIRKDSESLLIQQGGKFHFGMLHGADLIDPEVSK